MVGISLIIALGVALSGGLGSSIPWRTKSFEESYAMLNMFDLKLELTPGSYLDAEGLAQAVGSIRHAEWIKDMELRLRFPTSVDASTPGEYLLVSGQIIGVDVSGGGFRGLHPHRPDGGCPAAGNWDQYGPGRSSHA